MNILAIESSCDETAAAILSAPSLSKLKTSPAFDPNNPLRSASYKLLSNVVVSQIDIFKAYGGVIPEVAARSHLEAILPVIHQAFSNAGFIEKSPKAAFSMNKASFNETPSEREDWSKIDAIAVTNTPGLLGSLLVGTLTARTLAILHDKPLYPIHHLKSHIYSAILGNENVFSSDSADSDSKNYSSHKSECLDSTSAELLTDCCNFNDRESRTSEKKYFCFPNIALVISGGHTQLIYMPSENSFEIIGTTLDDAVGEAFDKIAKILGLPYPGGPSISKAALSGNPEKYSFPHPNVPDLNFSFSGLKTAVLRTIQKELGVPLSYPSHDIKNLLSETQIANFAASFQRTAIDILIEKLNLALKKYHDVNTVIIAGGVSANEELRKRISEKVSCSGVSPNPQTPAVRTTAITKRVRGNVVDERETNRCGSDDCAARTRTKPEREAIHILFPEKSFSGDNAAMVAAACYFEIESSVKPTDPYSLNILPRSAIN